MLKSDSGDSNKLGDFGNSGDFSEFLPGLTVITANDAVQSRGDASYPFTQDASFLYLTKINHPGWRLIIDGNKAISYLVAPVVSDSHQLFDGSLNWDEARRLSGIDNILSIGEGNDLLKKLSQRYKKVSTLDKDPYAKYFDFAVNPAQARLNRELKKIFGEIRDCRPALSRRRAIKTPKEVELIRQAISVSIDGFSQLKSKINEAEYEYELEAVLNGAFRAAGADGHAYTPIVAAGGNACTLHYVANNSLLRERQPQGALVLIDAAAAWHGYAADITRTYAVGSLTDRQRAVHKAVQTAQQKIINLLKPALEFTKYQESVDEIMKEAMASLGLLRTKEDYRRYFPHAISHGLGIDVHDSLGGYKEFKPGMVLTVEPGIYIPEENIGVRIEDDILITTDGYDNLSAALATDL